MHIADVKIPSNWTAFSTYTVVDADSEYVIFNSSPDRIYAVEGNTLPDAAVIGVFAEPGNYIRYKKGTQSNLYLKNGYTPVTGGIQKLSNITINKVG